MGLAEASSTIRPRQVAFEWGDTPLHWIPGDPFTTHLANVLHLLLPAGEKWFVDVYREAIPLVREERLRTAARGFMGQEAVHSRMHAAVLDHLRAQGLETAPYTRRIDWLFERLLASDTAPRFLRPAWLKFRLAMIAAVEQYTCVMGNWVLSQRTLDEAGADAIMLDLLRWHGAEEVEHRSVAFDIFQHLGGRGRYLLRIGGMLIAAPLLFGLWFLGARYLLIHDPTLVRHRYGLRDYIRSVRDGRAPGWELLRAFGRYLRPSHHPSHEGSLQMALDYLAISPAARAAG